MRQQSLDRADLAVYGSQHERGTALRVARIDFDVLVECGLQSGGIP